MSTQFSFDGFDEHPSDWGQTWSVSGEAPAVTHWSDDLLGFNWNKVRSKDRKNLSRLEGTYQLYISSDRWRERCVPIRQRANGHCERCKLPWKMMEVHHLTYERFGRELDRDLQALCLPCHDRENIKRRAAWLAKLASDREAEDFFGFLQVYRPGFEYRLSVNELLRAEERMIQWEEKWR